MPTPMKVSPCKNCGSGCLEEESPEMCNNCDPRIQALFKEYIEADEKGLIDG